MEIKNNLLDASAKLAANEELDQATFEK